MKLCRILFVLLTVILLLSCWNIPEKEFPVIHMKNKEQKDLLFFTYGNHLYGVDSQENQLALEYEFSSPVIFGDQSSDGRLFLAEINSNKKGDGDVIRVLNKDGKIIKTIPALDKPYTLKIAANKLVVDSAVFYENNYTAVSIYSLDNYDLEFQSKTLGNWMTNRQTWTWQNKIWLGIVPMAALNRPGYFWEYDPIAGKANIISELIAAEKREVYSFLILENQIWILWEKSLELEIYNLSESRKIKSINLNEFLSEEIPENAIAYDLRSYDDEVFTVLKDKTQQGRYQKLVFFKVNDVNQLRVKPLSGKSDLSLSTLLYLKNQKLYFKYLNQVDVFNLATGEFVKEIVFENN